MHMWSRPEEGCSVNIPLTHVEFFNLTLVLPKKWIKVLSQLDSLQGSDGHSDVMFFLHGLEV